MGSSSYSDDFYKARVVNRAATNSPTFAHTAAVAAGTAKAGTHAKLDPKGVTRESRDSAEHPNSVAIGVMFDVTGSMQSVPRVLQEKIPQLMGLLLRKGYVQDPQIMFGAVGDYYSDQSPLQVGQFESGIEMDDDITNLYLEGNGGGQNRESYQDALYFFARHTSIDCFEKRGKKGYLFLIGDEHSYDTVLRKEAADVFGDTVEVEVTTKQLIEEVQSRYELFFIIPSGTSHFRDPALRKHWAELVGAERVIILEDPAAVCEAIGLAIGLIEGTTDLHDAKTDLAADGASASIVTSVASALDPLAKKTALARAGTGGESLPVASASPAGTARL